MGPLDGVRVLAIENFIAGPYGSMLLADFGAEVIKVEPPRGDSYRAATPNYQGDAGRMSYSFLRVNRNKKSVVLDLSTPEDRERFLRLCEDSDVVWENLRPGAFNDLGVGWDVLRARNPGLVYASISGFGRADVLPSPYMRRPAFDIVAQAMSGLMSRVGQDPQPPHYLGVPMADQHAGTMAALGVTLALYERQRTGTGQRVDISMYDVMVALNEQAIGHYSHFGEEAPRGMSPTSAPYAAYRCEDGWAAIGIASDGIWAKFCRAIGADDLLDDDRLTTGLDRARCSEDVLRPRIEAWTSPRTKSEVVDRLNAAGVPCGPVQTVTELFECDHLAARDMLITLEDPVIGQLTVAGNPVKLGDHLRVPRRTAPQLGADQLSLFGREATTTAEAAR